MVFWFFQDYHWWWRSFLTSSFTAVYLFIYAVHYFFSKLQITGTASTILYFGYTMIMVLIFFLFTGKYSVQTKMNAGVSIFLNEKHSVKFSLSETVNTIYDSLAVLLLWFVTPHITVRYSLRFFFFPNLKLPLSIV